MRFRNLFVAAALSASALVAHADSITYTTAITYDGLTAVGTITTDGNTGVLTTSDILNYNLVLSSSTLSFPVNSGVLSVTGTDLTATTTGLFYNFDDVASTNSFFLTNADGTVSLCFTGAVGCNGGGVSGVLIKVNSSTFDDPISGTKQLGYVPLAATPEPSSFALLGSGLVGMAGFLRKRLKKA